MSLMGEVDEIVTTWRKASWAVRFLLLVSGFLSVSAIASMSEQVTKWKGFFKDEIEFYRGWISTPLQVYVFPLIGLHFPHSFVDFLVFYFLAIGSLVRSMVIVSRNAPLDWRGALTERGEGLVKRGAFLWGGFACTTLAIMIFFIVEINKPPYRLLSETNYFFILSIIMIVLFGFSAVYLGKIFQRGVARFYIIQLAVVFLVVGVMAAINAGLSR